VEWPQWWVFIAGASSLSGDVGPSRDQIIDVAPNASGGRNGLSDSMYYIY